MDKAIEVLKQEVKWHQENQDTAIGMSKDRIDGFNEGCQHCLSLLIKCNKVNKNPT